MLHIDFETYCDLNVVNVGPQCYARHPSCEVLMMSYAFREDGPIKLWVPDGRWDYASMPRRVSKYLLGAGDVCAHNVEFEWNILWHVLGFKLGLPRLRDTAVMSLRRGYPMSLAGAAKATELAVEKDTRGKQLIRKFCAPRKPTKANPRTRLYPEDSPTEWKEFCDYCVTDTDVERKLWSNFGGKWPLNNVEQWVWEETLRMNELGIRADIPLAKKTIAFMDEYNHVRVELCKDITFGIAPTQVKELTIWLREEVPSLKTLKRLELEQALVEQKLDPDTEEVIRIRLEQGRVSTKKLDKMLEVNAGDDIIRGSFVYHGASTARFTARRVQPHNFQRPTIKDVPRVLDLLNTDPHRLIDEFPDVLEAIGSAMRGFLIPHKDHWMVVADYNAIEARVLAWLAEQLDLVQLFHDGKDVYCDMAGHIFGEDPLGILAGYKDGDFEMEKMRKLGKDTVLGCGYAMWVNTFLCQMESKGSDDIAGIPLREDILLRGQRPENTFTREAWEMGRNGVLGYRERYQKIPKLWNAVERAAKDAIRTAKSDVPVTTSVNHGKLKFLMIGDSLVMKLPSGRNICYPQAVIVSEEDRWGRFKENIKFRCVNSKNMWVWEYLYGGKAVENAVQAIARDLMVCGMRNADKNGFRNIGTVHDELLTLFRKLLREDMDEVVKEFCKLICILPHWAKGETLAETIPLKAEGYYGDRFKK